MFREMRRIRQQISREECVEILQRATSGVLGLHGDDGYPYTVPVSFVWQEGGTGLGIIGFHCAIRLSSITVALSFAWARCLSKVPFRMSR